MFYVGQKVVCIKKDAWLNAMTGELTEGPTYNQICTIRGFDDSDYKGLLLVEFTRPDYYPNSNCEIGFSQKRFRPSLTITLILIVRLGSAKRDLDR